MNAVPAGRVPRRNTAMYIETPSRRRGRSETSLLSKVEDVFFFYIR